MKDFSLGQPDVLLAGPREDGPESRGERRGLEGASWQQGWVASAGTVAETRRVSYVNRMSRGITTTVRLDAEDAEALRRARADGQESSELIRRGLRLVASRYYPKKRRPHLGLFQAVDPKLGDESELFGDLEK